MDAKRIKLVFVATIIFGLETPIATLRKIAGRVTHY
jgi:hypothetical protein